MRATASIWIRSKTFTHEVLTRRLKLAPDWVANPGDRMVGKFLYPEAQWSRRSRLPHSAPLAEHLLSLITLLDPLRATLRAIGEARRTTVHLSCSLIGEQETAAVFDVPANVVEWCSQASEIALNCFPPEDEPDSAEENCESVDNEGSGSISSLTHQDHAFGYLVGVADPVLSWEAKGVSADQLLPRPKVAAPLIITSDLPESAIAPQHLERVLFLFKGQTDDVAPRRFELICLYSAEKTMMLTGKRFRRSFSTINLGLPLLRDIAQLKAGIRIGVYRTPSELRRLRGSVPE